MIGKNKEVVNVIQEFVSQKRQEYNIVNKIIRDDVFAILEKQCVVLYYPLPDDKAEGCHIIKPLGNGIEQFVFINTTKEVQEQTWTAAHELGHVWEVDSYVKHMLNRYDLNAEHLVNRFAAELLLPQEIFHEELRKKLDEYGYKGPKMQEDMMVRLVTHLMNYFCTPYKAIIRRFIELDYIEEDAEEAFLQGFRGQRALYDRLIIENQYTRLRSANKACSMEAIEQDINLLEQNGIFSDKKIAHLRTVFHLEKAKANRGGLYTWGMADGQSDKSGD